MHEMNDDRIMSRTCLRQRSVIITGSLVRVRDARRLTRVPSDLATFDLRAETMFWAVENPSPSNNKCLDGGFVSYMFVSLLIDSLILGIRARADGENAGAVPGPVSLGSGGLS